MGIETIILISITAGLSAASMGMQYLSARKMAKQNPIERGKNNDIRITGSELNSVIPRVFGVARLCGNIIWGDGITEAETQSQQGGKGLVPKRTVSDFTYYTSLQILIVSHAVQSVRKVWANDKLIFNTLEDDPNSNIVEAEAGTLIGDAEIVSDAFCSRGLKVTGIGDTGSVHFDFLRPIPPRILRTELGESYTTLTIYYKSTEEDRELRVFSQSLLGMATDTQTVLLPQTGNQVQTYTIHIPLHPDSITFDLPTGASVDLDRIAVWMQWENGIQTEPVITGIDDPFVLYNDNRIWEQHGNYNYLPPIDPETQTSNFNVGSANVRVYRGSMTQLPDSILVTKLGEGNVSAHRGMSYVVLDNYQLPDGQMPNFTFEIDEGSRTAAEIVKKLYNEKGIPDERLDLSAIYTKYIGGYVTNQMTSSEKIIDDVGMFCGFRMVDRDGKHVAVLTTGEPIMTIPYSDFRSFTDQDSMTEYDVKITEKNEKTLPKTVYVSVLSQEQDGYAEAKQSELYASTQAQETLDFNFPITSSGQQAKEVSDRILLEMHSRKQTLEGMLPPKYSKLSAGDFVTIQLKSGSINCQIMNVQKSFGGSIKIQAESTGGVFLNDDINYFDYSDSQPSSADAPIKATQSLVFESAPVDLIHAEQGLGIYAAMSSLGYGRWQGGAIDERINEAEDWRPLYQTNIEAAIGDCQDTLGSWFVRDEDDENELTIFYHNEVELSNASNEELDARLQTNLMRVGEEWLQFRTAEPVEPTGVYKSGWKISDLRRGLLGTQANNHFANEKALVYNPASVRFIPLSSEYFNQVMDYRTYSAGRTIDHSTTRQLLITGLSIGQGNTPVTLPPNPCQISINQVPTNTTAIINVSSYPLTCRYRKIEVSLNSDMSDSVETVIDSISFPNMLLPESQNVVTESLSSATQKYIAVSHSNDNIRWSNRSNILDPIFADDTNSGGSIGNAPPTFTSVSYNSSTEEVNLVFAKNGTGTGNIQVEYKKSAVSSWTTASTTFAHNLTSGSFALLKEATLQNYDIRLKQSGITGYSEIKVFNTPATSSSATPPTNLTYFVSEGAFCERQVELFWTAGTGTGEYIIERQEGFMGIWEMIGTSSSANFIDNVVGTNLRQNFAYRVSQSGVSGYTNTVNVSVSQCYLEPL